MTAYVHLEIKRIQSYLFSVPKLKAMVGANVILGETVTGRREDVDPSPESKTLPDNLVQCALRAGAEMPPEVASMVEDLKKEGGWKDDDFDEDCPLAFFAHGIISHHGGHLGAFFPDVEHAKHFITSGTRLVARKLPGATVTVKRLLDSDTCSEGWASMGTELSGERSGEVLFRYPPVVLPELPIFAMCQGSGNEPASRSVKKYGHVSESYKHKLDAAKRYYEGKSQDIAGALFHEYYSEKMEDRDFSHLSSYGYMAVVHADGNDMGRRSQQSLEQSAQATEGSVLQRFFHREVQREQFFFTMRKKTRRALVAAVDEVFGKPPGQAATDDDYDPRFRVFMAGGDDLLLVCAADKAMEFVKSYAKHVEGKESAATKMTIGAGVVIAHHNIPFYQLHSLAEELASNAKARNRYLGQVEEKGYVNESVVDWVIGSESSLGELEERRTTNTRIRGSEFPETLWLTQKPYPVLPTQEGSRVSLEDLLDIVPGGRVLARSKVKELIDNMRRGPLMGHLLYEEMVTHQKTERHKQPFEVLKARMEGDGSEANPDLNLWPFFAIEGDEGTYYSNIPDLIELMEIDKLGSRGEEEK